MSDEQRRSLERRAAAGDEEAVARLHEELRRTGEVRAFEEAMRSLVAHAGVSLGALDRVLGDALRAPPPATRTSSTMRSGLVVRAGPDGVELWACQRAPGLAEPPFDDQEAVAEALLAADPTARHLRARRDVVDAWWHESRGPWQPVRTRPAMYFGSTGLHGLHMMLEGALAVALADHLRGQVTRLEVHVGPGARVRVIDDGPGRLRARRAVLTPDLAVPAPVLEMVLSPAEGPGAADDWWDAEGWLDAACSASESFEVTLSDGATTRRARYERGRLVGAIEESTTPGRRGRTISLQPDGLIFETPALDRDALEGRLTHLAALCPFLSTRFVDVEAGRTVDRRPPGGLREHVAAMFTAGVLAPPAVSPGVAPARVRVDLAFTAWARARSRNAPVWRPWGFHDDPRASLLVFVNHVQTGPGGTIEAGLRAGLAAAAPTRTPRAAVERVRKALVGVVHVLLEAPQFLGATRAALTNPEVEPAVRDAVVAALAAANPEQVAALWARAARASGRRSR